MNKPSLLAVLKRCPTHPAGVTREQFLEGWAQLRGDRVSHLLKPTAPIMAALVLHDSRFAQLLAGPELAHLQSLVQLALDRYEQQTNPPNQLGKLLAGGITKE